MSYFLRNAVLAAAIACVPPAFATPVTLQAGQELVWNVDLTNTLPGTPPFTSASILTGINSLPAATGSWEFFADHDMQGGMVGDPQALAINSWTSWDAALFDGIFSVRVAVASGSVDLDLRALGWLNTVRGAIVNWEPAPQEVPEPATLSLACLGLLAAAALRRRRSD